jgi:hypothetical protein
MIEDRQQLPLSPVQKKVTTESSETHGPTILPPSNRQSNNKEKPHSLLGRLRIIKVSPCKGKRPSNEDSNAPLPNEVVVVDGASSPFSCTEHEEIEASLESALRVLRKPSRFTFDIVPSFSESFDDRPASPMAEEDDNQVAVVRNSVNRLSIHDETHNDCPLPSDDISKQSLAGTIGPTQLNHRSRTNSTSATSAFSVEDVFSGSTASNDVVKMTTTKDALILNGQNTTTDIVSTRQSVTESSWLSLFSVLVGSSSTNFGD